MSIHVTCQCGKKLRLPDDRAGRKGRCPSCGSIFIIPAAAQEAAAVGAGRPDLPDERAWCAECGNRFPAEEMVDIDGRFICRSCLGQGEETGLPPAATAGPGRKAFMIGGAAAVLIITVAVVRYSTAGKSSKPTAAPSPITTVQKTQEPAPTPEEGLADATDTDAAAKEPAEAAPVVAAAENSRNSAKRTEQAVDLLWTFLPGVSESFESYRDHEITLPEQDLMQKLLSDEGLVGDGQIIELPYPVPDPDTWVASAAGKMPQQESAATLDLYVRGKGITLKEVRERFGAPRMEKKAPDGLCLVYGNAGVVFGKKDEFLGVVAVLIPETEKKPADVAQGEPMAVAAATPQDETAGKLASAARPEPILPDKSKEETPEGGDRKLASNRPKEAEPANWGPKFDLAYQPIKNPEDPLAAMGRRYANAERQGSRDFFAMLGGQKVAMTLEPGQQPMIRVDTNGDGNLSDEKPLRGLPIANRLVRGFNFRFGPITFDSGKEGVEPVEFFVQTMSASSLMLYPARYRTGEVRLGGETYRVALVDSNLDGRYNRVCRLPLPRSAWASSDCIALDRNKNKRFELGGNDQWEVQPLTRLIAVKDKYCFARPAPDGASIQFADASPKCGTLDVGQGGIELFVLGDAGIFHLTGDGKWDLPEGRYSCWSVILHDIGRKSGSTAILASTDNTGRLGNFAIDAGHTAKFSVGPPLIVRTNVSESRQGAGRIVSVGLKITDGAGVEYEAGVTIGGQKQPPPGLFVMAGNNRRMAQGNFAYG